ncbi:hypothetical protein FJT64_017095 [Amphibalanus amphitrite]|uniref:Integrase SAM-like N-terminal domain-containing protein n=1 Tax=Amphibalanus amphitrite TaxID=1232801 RepID=A0A6A4WX45_AMPAM|nr:hypothetical protein FJT64_017095 [Amphibalanus amphitrite]
MIWHLEGFTCSPTLAIAGMSFFRMLLVLGDSYAHRFRSICDAGDSITASGWRGACVGDDEFRRWAIREAVLRRPQRVFLMVGSNDLARPLQDMISGMIRSALASASSVPEAATGPAPTPASGAPEASTGPATAPDAVLRLAAAAAPTTSEQLPTPAAPITSTAGVPAPAARSGRLTGAMGLGDLQHPDIVSELADAALAPATIKAYRTTWAQFRHFLCRPAPRDLFPVSVSQVVDFLAHRYDAGCGSATLASISSAISYGHKVRGLVDPTADFRVRQVLAGARRLRPGGDSRLAITAAWPDWMLPAFRAIVCA